MGKRLGVLGAVIVVAALVVGVAIPAAAGSSGDDHQHQTIRVTAIVTELNLVAVSSKGPSLGDEIVFAEKLLQRGNQVGHEGAVCTTVSLVRQEAQCVATYSFGGGQITAQALITLGSKAPYAGAITGGTGSYEGAAGEVHVSPVSDTEGILTFDLQD
jgi:hypothetical protein